MADKGGLAQWAAAVLPVVGNLIAGGGPKRQYKYNKRLAEDTNRMNRENAEWAFMKELELRKYQAEYDSPAAQVQRFKDAGLNPNLIYGHGSAAAGSFEAPRFPNVPGVSMGQVDAHVLGSMGTQFQQARLMAAQTDLTRTKEQESTVKQDLIEAQTAVTKANPYLEPGYVKSLVSQLESTAKMKEQEASWRLRETWYQDDKGAMIYDAKGIQKMQAELDLLQQRFKLGTADQKIKAEIVQSKEFQNALSEIQVKWMQDAEITPQHIYQGIFMLLQSLMRK